MVSIKMYKNTKKNQKYKNQKQKIQKSKIKNTKIKKLYSKEKDENNF